LKDKSFFIVGRLKSLKNSTPFIPAAAATPFRAYFAHLVLLKGCSRSNLRFEANAAEIDFVSGENLSEWRLP